MYDAVRRFPAATVAMYGLYSVYSVTVTGFRMQWCDY